MLNEVILKQRDIFSFTISQNFENGLEPFKLEKHCLINRDFLFGKASTNILPASQRWMFLELNGIRTKFQEAPSYVRVRVSWFYFFSRQPSPAIRSIV